jgi:hypothetical protein
MHECQENAEEYSHTGECIMQILPGGNEEYIVKPLLHVLAAEYHHGATPIIKT